MKEFYKILRKMGFKRAWTYTDVCEYHKEYSDRVLHVQLWKDGGHRVSHMHDSPYTDEQGNQKVSKAGCMNTYPTDFRTVDGMVRAIEFEISRKDFGSKYQHIVEVG